MPLVSCWPEKSASSFRIMTRRMLTYSRNVKSLVPCVDTVKNDVFSRWMLICHRPLCVSARLC
eukprot:380053-Rhodomonas_salina.1